MVRDLVAELNRVIAPHLGILLELYGWEQQRPRAGRPQDIINPHVDRCHLFIGLLAERWGSATGSDTSGFHEEFQRILERRTDSGPPEIMLAFRTVDPARERDAGRQLKKVLKFRDQMQREHGLLYQMFSSVAELQGMLRDWLQAHLFDFAQARALAVFGRGGPPALPSRQGTALATTTGGLPKHAPPLLIAATDAVNGMLHQATFDGYVDAAMGLSHEQLLRLRLNVNAWSYVLHHTEPLGMHDQNSLYQSRDQIALVPPEHALIRSALVGDLQDVLPGWYWFRDDDVNDVSEFLVRAALEARTVEMRARAIRLLGEARIRLDDEAIESLLESAALDDTAQVPRAVTAYARDIGDEALLRRLESAAGFGDNVTQKERFVALVSVLAQIDPAAAAAESVRGFVIAPAEARRVIESHAEAVSDATLATMLVGSTNTDLTDLAQRLKIHRGGYTEGQLRELLSSTSVRTREAATRSLILTGGAITVEEIRTAFPDKPTSLSAALLNGEQESVEADTLVLELFKKLPESALRAKLDVMSLDSPIAYQALGLSYFTTFASQLRTDLETQFESIWPGYLTHGSSAASSPVGDRPETSRVAKFLLSLHAEAAVAALAENGGPDDVRFATAFLLNARYIVDPKPAIRLISGFGQTQDAITLLTYAERAYGADAVEAARGAVRLSPGPGGAVARLLASSNDDLIREGLRAMQGTEKEHVISASDSLLAHPRDKIRLAATALLVAELEPADLANVMQQYRTRTTYFYDVGCWLDRVLFAPEPLRTAFRRLLLVRLDPTAG